LPRQALGPVIHNNSLGVHPLKRSAAFLLKPLPLLIILIVLYSVDLSVLALRGTADAYPGEILWRLSLSLLMVYWVAVDRNARNLRMPYEFDAFVFFGWILVVPYYLIKTRGLRGSLNAIGLLALIVFPNLISGFILLSR
jgi:hypothetical protein